MRKNRNRTVPRSPNTNKHTSNRVSCQEKHPSKSSKKPSNIKRIHRFIFCLLIVFFIDIGWIVAALITHNNNLLDGIPYICAEFIFLQHTTIQSLISLMNA